MNKQFKTNSSDTVEKLTHKYLERRKQLPLSEEKASQSSDEAVQRLNPTHRSKQSRKELKRYSKTLHELFKAISNYPDQFGSDSSLNGSDEDLSGDCTLTPLQESQVLFTETDVTLPSCLDGSSGFQQTNGKLQRTRQSSDSCCSPSSSLAKVYQEMMTIYEHLKAERQSQQQWERELQERERTLKQQEEALGRLAGLEEILHSRMVAVEEKHQQELKHLQDLLRERSKENRRLKSSFDTIKELNDNMKKQLNEISEQNKKLESQSKRVQARLENLQKKYEQSIPSKGCHKVSTKCVKASKTEKAPPSGKPSCKGSTSPTSLKLLALLLDWVLDGQMFSSIAGNKGKDVGQFLPPEVILNERCLKVLPLLADQLHLTHLLEPGLLLNLLRLIHWALRRIESSTQHVALFATLRRIGETVSKPQAQATVPTSEDPDLPKSCSGRPSRNWPLYRSPCPHTRILSTLIILRTVTQGYLTPFLDACSCEEFFRTASRLLKTPHLELPLLEKLSILLQKLSGIRKNQRLFDLSYLHLQIQELHHKTNHTHTFLSLNLRSILQNLK
ncbi:hypothetical protein PAMP_003969 [Pampus punctatissimus]